MNKIHCDFLIIGTGLAGLYSAIKAAQFGKVSLLSKSTLEFSNTYWAQGGIAAVIDPSDSPEFHIEDTLIAGRGLCDLKAVEILVNEGCDRVKELIGMGMKFDSSEGNIELGMEGGHSKRRILHAGGDATGLKLVEFLSELIRKNKNITLFENSVVYKLIEKDRSCLGCYAFNYNSNEFFTFTANGTLLATGGASGVYKRSTNPYTTTGDGICLAYEVGAELRDMEFIQFHPTAFYSNSGDTFLISEAVRGEGAYLVNSDDKRFMLDYHERGELAPRDIVSLAIYNELKKSGKENVFLKLDHLDTNRIKSRFGTIYNEAKKFNIDITKDPVPITPAAHYTVGGIKAGYKAETNIKRLFVCGEASSSGVHGANRLASNSLLECLVFGKRGIDSIKELEPLSKADKKSVEEYKINIAPKFEDNLIEAKTILAECMNSNVGIVRNKEFLLKALDKFNELLKKYPLNENENYSLKLTSLITICKLIAQSALLREDSIGGHYRKDFPKSPEDKYHIKLAKSYNPQKVFN